MSCATYLFDLSLVALTPFVSLQHSFVSLSPINLFGAGLDCSLPLLMLRWIPVRKLWDSLYRPLHLFNFPQEA